MSAQSSPLLKGPRMEELLRSYFLKAGYYVVRGVPFVYERFDVTDIDLWLYSRTSSVSREVTLVDAKNKKTPQAIEHIFWVQGLRVATKATNAIVATTDKRQEVKDFGRELGVVVLDGAFLNKLNHTDDPNGTRLSDEELFARINDYSFSKLDGDWRGRLTLSKSLLARSLSFDSCNQWLDQARFFAEQAIVKGTQRETALRCLYLLCSFIAVAVDFAMKELSFHEQVERSALIKDGFTYGSRGSAGLKKVLNVAMGLVEQHAKDGQTISRQVKTSVEKQLAQLNTAILGEYFSKNDVARTLFTVAREFEQLAMARQFMPHKNASTELRGMLFCLLDFWGIDRVMFSEAQAVEQP
ncbi:hypothetical protein BVER_00816c [Candidatus Burkholderia verschuerenii]|uniref:Uncharacterized protein n=1 Tax=Candidatus Burkholderia verschuerenii TaxID=242163 RepID=A0A0L0MF88_9BURK|nr:hypothetical protein [Candidatus Burkholderia verschuerenii]KND60950.1 hypothetical protein BVER_00816c [Candidatus Burkholderia verschuerenii]